MLDPFVGEFTIFCDFPDIFRFGGREEKRLEHGFGIV
jgi:hypothetical protein